MAVYYRILNRFNKEIGTISALLAPIIHKKGPNHNDPWGQIQDINGGMYTDSSREGRVS